MQSVTWAQNINADEQKRFVLLIGNNDYEFIPKLKNPINDVETLAKPFEDFGFTSITKTNLNTENFNKAIQSFRKLLIENPNSIAIFYYAGHAVQVDGKNYLLPVNSKVSNRFDLEFEAIQIDKVLAALEETTSGVKVLILDACRDNPFQRGLNPTQSGLAEIENATEGTFIAYSTKPGGVALDQDINGLSIFAKELAFHLSGSTGLSIEELFKNTRRSVINRTKGFQVPWESSSLTGRFSFNPQLKYKTPHRAFFSLYMPKLYCESDSGSNKLRKLTQIDPTSGYIRRNLNDDYDEPLWSDWKPNLYRDNKQYYWSYYDHVDVIEDRNVFDRDNFNWNAWVANQDQVISYKGYCELTQGFLEDEIDKSIQKNCETNEFPGLCASLETLNLDQDFFNKIILSELSFLQRRGLIVAFSIAARGDKRIYQHDETSWDSYDLYLAAGLLGQSTWWVNINEWGQAILKDLGYDLVIDGDVGPKTCSAIADALGWEPRVYACGGNIIAKSTIQQLSALQ